MREYSIDATARRCRTPCRAFGASVSWRPASGCSLPARRCSSPPSLARGPDSVADVAEGLQDAVVNISTTQTLKGSAENAPSGPGPKGLAVRGVLRRFLRRRGQGRPAAQSELARLGLRHRPVRPRRHQQSRDRGRRRDHHQLHRRHQAEGGQDPRPRSQDRPRAAQSRAEEAAQGRHLRRLLQRCAWATG